MFKTTNVPTRTPRPHMCSGCHVLKDVFTDNRYDTGRIRNELIFASESLEHKEMTNSYRGSEEEVYHGK
jgi:hypothetical protein